MKNTKMSQSNLQDETAFGRRQILGQILGLGGAAVLGGVLGQTAWAEASRSNRVYVSMGKTNDRFLSILHQAVKAEIVQTNDLDVTIFDAHNDEKEQLAHIQKAIADRVGAYVQLSVNKKIGIEAAHLAAKANLPIVFLNRRPALDQIAGKIAIVSSNDLVAGRLQARLIAKQLNNSGHIVILRGEEGHPAAIERTLGVKEILSQRPNIKIIGNETGSWKRDQGEALAKQFLSQGHVAAFLCNNDEMALGVINTLKAQGFKPGQVLVGGVDGTPDALEAIDQGYLTLSLLQNAKAQGQQAIQDARLFVQNQYAQTYDWVPYELILKSNLAQFRQA